MDCLTELSKGDNGTRLSEVADSHLLRSGRWIRGY